MNNAPETFTIAISTHKTADAANKSAAKAIKAGEMNVRLERQAETALMHGAFIVLVDRVRS